VQLGKYVFAFFPLWEVFYQIRSVDFKPLMKGKCELNKKHRKQGVYDARSDKQKEQSYYFQILF